MRLAGRIGVDSRIDVSANLVDWSPLVTLPNVTGAIEFTDLAATNYQRRFYRAVVP